MDALPGIAGNDPAFRRLVLQRVEIFGLPGEGAHHCFALERAACIGFAHQADKIGAEFRIKDCVGLRGQERVDGRPRINLAESRPLLSHEYHVRAQAQEVLLETGYIRSAVLIIRCNRRPCLGRKLRRDFRKSQCVHVSGGCGLEGVAVAFPPDDGVAGRNAADEGYFALLGEVREGEADAGEEAAGENADPLGCGQFLGLADGVAGLGGVVAEDSLKRPPVDAAGGVDFFDGELGTPAIRLRKRRLVAVAVDVPNLDRRLGHRGGRTQNGKHRTKRKRPAASPERTARRRYPHAGFADVRLGAFEF